MPAINLEEQLRRSIHQVRAKKVPMTELAIVKAEQQGRMAAAVVVHGDLSAMNETQLATYYVELCRTLDLNPLTRPFTLLKLNGKLIYYANKDCSDQLRKRDKVSVRIVSRETVGELLVVTAEASLPDGRVDQAIGALSIGKLGGENLANALMKCETKAKRRVTLSICGLGMLDEEEVAGAQAEEGGVNGSGGAFSPHTVPGEDQRAPGDPDAARDLYSRFSALEADLDTCDSWERVNALRGLLGTRAQQSDLTRTIQQRGEAGDITPTQRAELGKTWMRCNRKLEKLEATIKPPPVESSFVDEPETDAFSPERQPGEDDS